MLLPQLCGNFYMYLEQALFSTALIFSTSLIVAFDTFSPAMKLKGKTLSQSIPPVLQNVEQFRRDFDPRWMASGSMLPTLEKNDKVLFDKHTYRSNPPERGDIAIFNPPPALQAQNFQNQFIYRIIGLPGETIAVKRGRVYINSQPLEENYIAEPPNYEYGPVQIPENSYFVMGDNRNNAYDSHYWGFLPREFIYGKAIAIYCPVERQTVLDSQPLDGDNLAVFSTFSALFQKSPSLCSLQQNTSAFVSDIAL